MAFQEWHAEDRVVRREVPVGDQEPCLVVAGEILRKSEAVIDPETVGQEEEKLEAEDSGPADQDHPAPSSFSCLHDGAGIVQLDGDRRPLYHAYTLCTSTPD